MFYFLVFEHVQSVEKFGTRKKRKEKLRKATDVEMRTRKALETFDFHSIRILICQNIFFKSARRNLALISTSFQTCADMSLDVGHVCEIL